MSKTKVLVIGGAGYIGSILVPHLLKKNNEVTVIDNFSFNQDSLLDICYNKNLNVVKGDFCDQRLIERYVKDNEFIIPLAAIVGAPACQRNISQTKLVNLDAPINLLKRLKKSHKVIFPTTNSGYGIGEKGKYCTEESPLKPISLYGKYKVKVENAYLDSGQAVSLRLATVFGVSPRMRLDLLVNNFVYNAITNKSLILFEEHFTRNYIHIRDVANAFVFAMDNYGKMKSKCYNVGLSNANLTKLELANLIKKFVPDLYIHCAEIGEDPDKRDYLVSNDKIEKLGWKPKFSIKDGILELIKAYQIIKPNKYNNI